MQWERTLILRKYYDGKRYTNNICPFYNIFFVVVKEQLKNKLRVIGGVIVRSETENILIEKRRQYNIISAHVLLHYFIYLYTDILNI